MRLNYQQLVSHYHDISIALSLVAVNLTLQLTGDIVAVILVNRERIVTFDKHYEGRPRKAHKHL